MSDETFDLARAAADTATAAPTTETVATPIPATETVTPESTEYTTPVEPNPEGTLIPGAPLKYSADSLTVDWWDNHTRP